ncbi:AAA family ATPase [Geodermatophilus sp. SYSU D00814]
METQTPLPTLSRGTANLITAVNEDEIRRRSELPRGRDDDSAVSRWEVEHLWGELSRQGLTGEVVVLRFAYALVGHLVDGIRFESAPYRLVVADEDLAGVTWESRLMSEPQLGQARERLLDAIRELRVYQEGDVRAPHKPLLLALVLAGYAKGTAKRWVTYSQVEGGLRSLIRQFSLLSPDIEAQEPFWRLKSSGVWTLGADGELDFTHTSPPAIQQLRTHNVRGGFDDLTDRALWTDDTLAAEAINEILQVHFPSERHEELREALSLVVPESAGLDRLLASATGQPDLHVLLRWQPSQNPSTVAEHRAVADREGSVWWGKIGDPARAAISAVNLKRLRNQMQAGRATHVYLYRPGEVWRTDLQQVETDKSAIDPALVPGYYEAQTTHHLWLRLANFTHLPDTATGDLVLASSGKALNFAGQSSIFLVNETAARGDGVAAASDDRYFILVTGADQHNEQYGDRLGERLGFDADVPGRNRLLSAGQGQFIYYQSGRGTPAHPSCFIGSGRVSEVLEREPGEDGKRQWGAVLEGYMPFPSPVPRTVYAPSPWSFQHGIAEITREQFEHIIALGSGSPAASGATAELTAAALEAAALGRGLRIDRGVYQALVAALRSGKHVILTGPPGTAKTTLAEVTAQVARRAGLCAGHTLTTATADWTTYETIGGLAPSASSGQLVFRPGHFLTSAVENKWLVIDELNRSNFDRAFGQLFTVLSGQSVALPYEDETIHKPIALVRHDDVTYSDKDYKLIRIPADWRIVATMNVFDKSLLFEMSFALMRRFAFVEVPAPEEQVFKTLWEPYVEDLEDSLAADVRDTLASLLAVRAIKDVGPAVFIDMARFAAEKPGFARDRLAYQLFYSYLLPQFEGIDNKTGQRLYRLIAPLVGTELRPRLRATLRDVLGVTVAEAPPSSEGEFPPEPDGAEA